jgi:hypothetical protein
MGSASRMSRCWGAAANMALALILASPASADVTTERGSSILIFPRVLSDSAGVQTGSPVDTIIQISNTSNSMVFAHCFYVNSAPVNPFFPPGVFNPPLWQEVDFDIWLTKQQPTHWVVSSGRREDPTDRACTRDYRDCSGAGFDPGLIPPVSDPFVGELKCVQVDAAGAPINGNQLKGEATIITPEGDASKYNAIGVLGLNTDTNSNDGDTTLCLGGGVSERCPGGAEYNACPQTLILNHFAENASNPVLDLFIPPLDPFATTNSRVTTELTLVPCSQDFENQVPSSVVVQFRLYNEFEEMFSASTTVTCWSSFRLNQVARVFDVGFLGTRFVQTRITPATDEEAGLIGVAEELHQSFGIAGDELITGRAALNLHGEGERINSDIIRLIEVQ